MTSGPQNEYGWTQGEYTRPSAEPPTAAGDALALSQPQAQAQAQAPWAGQPYAQPVVPVVAPKSGAIGVLLSFFIPGLGSMVNGSVGRGVLILAVYIVGWLLAFVLIGFPVILGAWIWGMVDGHLAAQRWNQAHGIIS
jgi:TM2 domain-containing membrane protein YozV